MLTRPVWAEVQLENLAHNIREVRRIVKKETKVCAVIKADGYGHGAVRIGQTLLDHGADYFAVATLSEALQLRKAFLDVPILILGYTPEELAQQVTEKDLIQTLWDLDQARAFSQMALAHKTKIKVHIKLDTGMSRVGFQVDDLGKEAVLATCQLEGLAVEGLYTHFACADEKDKTLTHKQVQRYLEMVAYLEAKGISIPIKHVANSAAIIDLPEYHFDMVRAGIMLYGLYPSPDVDCEKVALKEVMSLKGRLSRVTTIPAGEGVSYGHIYKTTDPTVVGTLPIGYADGYTRQLTQKAQVLVGGQRVPVIGKICMDQLMVALPDKGAFKRDDLAVFFGTMEEATITIDEVAAWLGTINYEIVCMIGKRVPRCYKRGEQQVDYHDLILD